MLKQCLKEALREKIIKIYIQLGYKEKCKKEKTDGKEDPRLKKYKNMLPD